MIIVRQTGDDAFVLVDTADESTHGTYSTLREALDAALPLNRARLAHPILAADDGTPRATWRWLDATAEEAEPQPDESQITPDAIVTMAARLNASDPIMVDGGAIPGMAPSEVHGSVQDSGTLAQGWAHAAVVWDDVDERTHMAFWTELIPEVAVETDSGRLAFGSIAFSQKRGDLADAKLVSHALTNLPAVPGLLPASSLRADDDGYIHARSRIHLQRLPMSTRSKNRAPAVRNAPPAPAPAAPPPAPAPAARGAAQDKVAQLRTVLNIPADTAQADLNSVTWDSIYALFDAAKLEQILGQIGGVATMARKPDEKLVAWQARAAVLLKTAEQLSGTRATLADVEPILAEMLGLKPEELGTALVKLAAAHCCEDEPDGDEALETEAAPVPPAAPADAKPADKPAAPGEPAKPEPPVAAKALPPPAPAPAPTPSPAQQVEGAKGGAAAPMDSATLATYADAVTGCLREIFGKSDGDPASMLTALEAAKERMKAALATPGDAGPGDVATMSADERAEFVKLREEKARNAAGDAVDVLAREAKKTLSAKQRELAVRVHLAGGPAMARSCVEGFHTPPQGQAVRSAPPATPAGTTPAPTGAVPDVLAIRRDLEKQIRAEHPEITNAREIKRLVNERMLKMNPGLLRAS